MANVAQYIELGALATEVIAITGKASDGASAAGYAAWVQSITGEYPKVVRLEGGMAKVLLSRQQAAQMRSWIDNQIAGSLRKKELSTLQIEFAPVVSPLLVKYGIIYGFIAFAVGVIAAKVLFR
jgi:hypothetical protein